MKKNIIILICCFLSFFVGAQNLVPSVGLSNTLQSSLAIKKTENVTDNQIDSLNEKNKFIDYLFYQDTRRHTHILTQRVDFWTNLGLCYNYRYHYSEWGSIGPELGIRYIPEKGDLPADIQRYGIGYYVALNLNFTIWRSISIESGGGISSSFVWPSSTNTSFTGAKQGQNIPFIFAACNLTFFKHLYFRAGPYLQYDNKPGNWYFTPLILGIGYKF